MKQHNDEAALLKFCERQDQTADYVRRTAEWIKTNYPASTARLIPKLRAIYKDKIRQNK